MGNKPHQNIESYINTWKEVAINQMVSHGIPASITLSQGILESGFGNSKLAVQANNHFGIKCHDWTGETFLKDDDKRNECFRKYKSAAHSFEDHSQFLTGRSRYAFLFELDQTDYKSWAKGLKKAGYATNPKYPKKLIELIELYDLDQYNTATKQSLIVQATPADRQKSKSNAVAATQKAEKFFQSHKVYKNPNRTKYIVAGEHDTFYQISKEFAVSLRQLNKWNDFPPMKDVLAKGDKIYIMRKRKSTKSDQVRLEINQNKPLWEIAQDHGIQLKALASLNHITSPDIALQKGDVVYLK